MFHDFDTGCGSTFVWLQRWTPVTANVRRDHQGSVPLAGSLLLALAGPLGYHRKRRSLILSNNRCLPGVGAETGASVVWRIGGALREIPQPPACVGVAPHGLNLGSVQPLPQMILGPLSNSTCLVKCLRGLVRAKVPAPNAPNALTR